MKKQLLFSVLLFSCCMTHAQYQQQAKIVTPDGKPVDGFGSSIAFSGNGNTMIVGAIYNNAGQQNSGAAYVYTRNGKQWVFDAKLTPAVKTMNEKFGNALALSGNG